MRRRIGSTLAILVMAISLLPTGSSAQASRTLDEGDFWSLMEQTRRLLDNALTSSKERASALAAVRDLWQGIDRVRLDDQTVLQVDLDWLRAVATADALRTATLHRRVQALLDYHARKIPPGDPRGSLAALDQVLRDPRFQYPDVTPTPLPKQNTESQVPSPVAAVPWQLAFILVGALVVGGVLFYLARTQRFQRAAVDQPTGPGDDPPTSTAAHDLAAESEAVHDYRNAIRYLYLASLLKLDERGLIHYDRTLTNREHLRQITGNPLLVEALQPLVNMFDRVWYGFAPVDEPNYQRFRQDVEHLEQLTP